MNTHDIPSRLAEAATNKVLWANSGVNTPESDRYLRLAMQAEHDVIGTQSATSNQIIAKLAMALDWAGEWATPSFNALIHSIIADVEGIGPSSAPARCAPAPRPLAGLAPASPAASLTAWEDDEEQAPPEPHRLPRKAAARPKAKVKAKAGRPATFTTHAVRIDDRAKPIIVHGVLYASIAAAMLDTGLSASQVKAISRPF